MNCDNCAWKSQCDVKKKQGRHRDRCEDYFPDLHHAKPRQPGRYATLEKRLQMKKREVKQK